ncbi:autotransporter outer membrane beta-barrel domain-containing protein [Methylobacterium sp. JK268]
MTTLLLSATGLATPAAAQTIFCPPVVTGVTNDFQNTTTGLPVLNAATYSLQNGRCTSGPSGNGAFSGAALASQALTGLSQTTTTETNRTTLNAVSNRREEESNRRRENQNQAQNQNQNQNRERTTERRRGETAREERGQDRSTRRRETTREERGTERRTAEPKTAAERKTTERRTTERTTAAERRSDRAAPRERERVRVEETERRPVPVRRAGRVRPDDRDVYEPGPSAGAPAPRPLVRKGYDADVLPPTFTYVQDDTRYGSWAQVFGDYERRTGQLSSNLVYTAIDGTFTFPFQVNQKSFTHSVGFLAGFDVTKRDVATFGDGLILGVLTGYTDTSVDITTRITFGPELRNGGQLPPGAARTTVALYGPSVGGYATYFDGPFSFDQILKADFFALDQRFTESAVFAGLDFFRGLNVLGGITGAGKTGVVQLSSAGNANYRIPVNDAWWIEPTVGYQYIHSFYDTGAAALGLRDGDLVRVQGGARLGFEAPVGSSRFVFTLTGLVYNNVLINGGFIQAGAFGSNTLALNDQGKTRGEGILAVALDYGNGWSSFVQGNVRGGDQYFAAGGRAGIRYQW